MSTKIEWTNATLNITSGCTQISAGCQNCYAKTMHERLRSMSQPKYQHDFNTIQLHPEEITKPDTWKKPRMIFVNSMSDLFHKDIHSEFISAALLHFGSLKRHTFQILTKRADRLLEFTKEISLFDNIWVGVTVESEAEMERIHYLTQIPTGVRFVSFEPLLTRIATPTLKQMICGTGAFTDQPYNTKIDWAIVGGETGHHARSMQTQWAEEILFFCIEHKIPFFFKKHGGQDKRIAKCRTLSGRIWEQWPNIDLGKGMGYPTGKATGNTQ